jgi:hypothetical protein
MAKFVPYSQGQQYLYEKFGIPPASMRQQRQWIVDGIFPQPVSVSPGRLAFTDEQLDRHGQSKLDQAKG